MKAFGQSIESNLKLIAVVGAAIFLTLLGALIFVQRGLGSTQAALVDDVVPTTRVLGDLTGALGDIFLRQSQIVSSSADTLPAFADRSKQERAVAESLGRLESLMASSGLTNHERFPESDFSQLRQNLTNFMAVDSDLLQAVSHHHHLENLFNASVEAIDFDLRVLMQESSGLAGELRLEYITMLRRIDQGLDDGEVNIAAVRSAIVGNARSQLDAIDELDDAVLSLGVLAGKVGLTMSDDAMNSLAANQLAQNRDRITSAIKEIERVITDPSVARRIEKIHVYADDMVSRVGDESQPQNLATLRRQILAQDRYVHQIQEAASGAAGNLNQNTTALRSFSESVARAAQQEATNTIQTSRYATVVVCAFGLALACLGWTRVQKSIVSLRAQNKQLGRLSGDLARANDGLEKTVADRTAALQLILDSSGEGMVAVNMDGTLHPERSRAVTTWFGEAPADVKIWDYLAGSDEHFADSFEMAFDQIAMDFLPFDVSAGQAPSIVRRDGRAYGINFREVRENDELSQVSLIIRDVTRELEAEKAESEARELHAVVRRLLRDRLGFQQTIEECTELIHNVQQCRDMTLINRGLHTIKGNTALIGFQRISDYVHCLEGILITDERMPTKQEVDQLADLWYESLGQIEEWLDLGRTDLHVEEADLDRLIELTKSQASPDDIVHALEVCKWEPTSFILRRLSDRIKQVAKRLKKQVDVVTIDGSLRIPPDALKGFWTAITHVLRNAVDHGLEDNDERSELGKPAAGRITLSTCMSDGFLEIRVADDGRGIDWERVMKRAEDHGLPCSTHDDLVNALFSDGLSTRDTATDISGRGVGLGAVTAICEELHGTVDVTSELGKGTEFSFRFPWKSIDSRTKVKTATQAKSPHAVS